MSRRKQAIRANFRNSVFERDEYKCRVCGVLGIIDPMFPGLTDNVLDAHHITDRTLIVNGGYVKENGISLCQPCHFQAECFHRTGTAAAGYEPETLYKLIGSSLELATEKAKKL